VLIIWLLQVVQAAAANLLVVKAAAAVQAV
jgi:hypothetical protein